MPFTKPNGTRFLWSILLALGVLVAIVPFVAPAALAQTDTPDAPTDVKVYTLRSQQLDVRWSSSDTGSTTSFKIRWKSPTEAFDSSRELASDPDASIIDEQSTSVGGRYAETITGLTNGAEYTVRVIASNADGNSDPSPETRGTPQAALGDARLFIQTEVIEWFEGSHPWLRDTWGYMTRQNVRVTFQRTQGGWVDVDCSDRAIELRMRKCTASAVYIGRDDPRIIYVIVHELAHIYTLSNGVADSAAPLGVAMVYFNELLTPAYLGLEDKDLWQSGCPPHELYADALSLATIGDSLREDLFYWKTCPLITDDLGDQALAVAKSAGSLATHGTAADAFLMRPRPYRRLRLDTDS